MRRYLTALQLQKICSCDQKRRRIRWKNNVDNSSSSSSIEPKVSRNSDKRHPTNWSGISPAYEQTYYSIRCQHHFENPKVLQSV